MCRVLFFICACLLQFLITTTSFGQASKFITDVELRTDNGLFTLSNNLLSIRNEPHLAFFYEEEDETVEVFFNIDTTYNINTLSVDLSTDFDIIDSLSLEAKDLFRMKVRLKRLSESNFLRFSLVANNDQVNKQIIRLFTYTRTNINLNIQENELYVGEEKTFELFTDLPENIRLQAAWQNNGSIKYRITRRSNRILLHLLPEKIGTQEFNLSIKLKRPYFDSEGSIKYEYPLAQRNFQVKESRLTFLNVDQEEIILETNARYSTYEIQLDYHRDLQLQKTYRIEARERPGGALIAELFTKTELSNGRVLCDLRVYDYHRLSDGYLYIKSGDEASFITNFTIRHNTSIQKVSIQRNGGEWTENLSVFPGEIIDVKVEGEALDRAGFRFEGLFRIKTDSTSGNENRQVFTLNIPLSVYKKKIEMLNFGEPTGYAITVQEYQRPKDLQFVKIDYGLGEIPITDITTTVFYGKTIKDIVFSFDPDVIDSLGDLYGKQYLFMEVQVVNNRKQLIDQKRIDNITICPEGNSLRRNYYNKNDCRNDNINLNNILRTKTHELNEWARVEIILGHVGGKYRERVYQQKIEIILSRKATFDIDISFPAGLLTLARGQEGISSLGGISLAAIAQFTFYKPEAIAKSRPYRAGVGILAFDAFNFRENANRYLALVALGSVYPINRSNSKFNFPLHIGGGYRLNDLEALEGISRFFFLIGPGIRIRF